MKDKLRKKYRRLRILGLRAKYRSYRAVWVFWGIENFANVEFILYEYFWTYVAKLTNNSLTNLNYLMFFNKFNLLWTTPNFFFLFKNLHDIKQLQPVLTEYNFLWKKNENKTFFLKMPYQHSSLKIKQFFYFSTLDINVVNIQHVSLLFAVNYTIPTNVLQNSYVVFKNKKTLPNFSFDKYLSIFYLIYQFI